AVPSGHRRRRRAPHGRLREDAHVHALFGETVSNQSNVLDKGPGPVGCLDQWPVVGNRTVSDGWQMSLRRTLSRGVVPLVAVAALAVPSSASAADFPLKGWWPLAEGKGQVINDWSGRGNQGYLGETPQADSHD